MFPDLRLLISATVATFFLAATAGLYASLRITHDQLAARTDGRTTIEDSPIARISAAWPLPESGRAAALRDLAKIAKYAPAVPGEAEGAERGDISAAPDKSGAPDATGSTGLAVQPENPAASQTDQGNTGKGPDAENADAGAEKPGRAAAKKALQASRKKAVKTAQHRKKIERSAEQPAEQSPGYPLYLTVPVTN